ncbi:hypothetical protein SASPL_144964 [Salvia splendens]|uniref:Uncharacterized protein n=1 Tax=Salvia splendens TaxID=180675 RepID=A0A8X8WFR7_SALSN|nr:hypothetical protein SASPL_144964 [Salvia splendens]
MNTLYVDSVTKEHNGCNRDYISVDINPIDDSLIDQACSMALNINNEVIVADNIEEQSTQVQALADTDFCTEFLDSVNPQSEVMADSQPLLSRGCSKDPLQEATNKGVAVLPAASSLTASAITEVPLEPRATIYGSKATALALNNQYSFTDSTTASQHSRSLVTFFGDSKQRCEDLRLGAVEGVHIFDPGA